MYRSHSVDRHFRPCPSQLLTCVWSNHSYEQARAHHRHNVTTKPHTYKVCIDTGHYVLRDYFVNKRAPRARRRSNDAFPNSAYNLIGKQYTAPYSQRSARRRKHTHTESALKPFRAKRAVKTNITALWHRRPQKPGTNSLAGTANTLHMINDIVSGRSGAVFVRSGGGMCFCTRARNLCV